MEQIGAAAAANNPLSAQCAIRAMKDGGSAADAAIVALLMDGVNNPQSMGIGGGFLMTHYKRNTGLVEVLNAREFSPAATKLEYFKNCDNFLRGLSSGIPSEVKGFWALHQKYGRLPWKRLFEDPIKSCREGIVVSPYLGGMLDYMKKLVYSHPSLVEIFESKVTGELYKTGDVYCRPKLAETFELIAENGPDVLYNGPLTKGFVEDIRNADGIISTEDLKNYSPVWMVPEKTQLQHGLTIYTTPLPSAGAILHFILKVLFGLTDDDFYGESESMRWFRLAETWKHAYGLRINLEGPTRATVHIPSENAAKLKSLIDPTREIIKKTRITNQNIRFYTEGFYVPPAGGGTGHISILAPDGDAVAVTSSINATFGAAYASQSTGIMMNNHMMDFNFEPSRYTICNFVKPHKQPLSSMSPSILLKENGDVRMVVGAAGGPKIITSISIIVTQHLLYNVPLKEAMYHPRIHHGLMPMKLFYESGFPFITDLLKRGHHVQLLNPTVTAEHFIPSNSSVSVIGVQDGVVEAYGDPRRFAGGVVA